MATSHAPAQRAIIAGGVAAVIALAPAGVGVANAAIDPNSGGLSTTPVAGELLPAVRTASPGELLPAVRTASPGELLPAVRTASPGELLPAVRTSLIGQFGQFISNTGAGSNLPPDYLHNDAKLRLATLLSNLLKAQRDKERNIISNIK